MVWSLTIHSTVEELKKCHTLFYLSLSEAHLYSNNDCVVVILFIKLYFFENPPAKKAEAFIDPKPYHPSVMLLSRPEPT
jgi:hypothetical protein